MNTVYQKEHPPHTDELSQSLFKSIIHEIRNSLTSIYALSDLNYSPKPESLDSLEFLKEIKCNARRCENLVKQLSLITNIDRYNNNDTDDLEYLISSHTELLKLALRQNCQIITNIAENIQIPLTQNKCLRLFLSILFAIKDLLQQNSVVTIIATYEDPQQVSLSFQLNSSLCKNNTIKTRINKICDQIHFSKKHTLITVKEITSNQIAFLISNPVQY